MLPVSCNCKLVIHKGVDGDFTSALIACNNEKPTRLYINDDFLTVDGTVRFDISVYQVHYKIII